ncbi:MAG: PAS domain S-box protein [Anaerolineales bacterium]|nr:PAS domain S-box protein [Anaerolineales bacterium]
MSVEAPVPAEPVVEAAALRQRVAALEAALAEAQAETVWSRLALESLPDLVLVADLEGVIWYLNAAGAAVLGRRPAEVQGQNLRAVFEPPLSERLAARLRQVGETGQVYQSEAAFRLPAGPRWLHYRLAPVTEPHTGRRGCLVTAREVAEPRPAQAAGPTAEGHFRAMFESAPLGMVLTDRHGRITHCNAIFSQMLARPAAELLGQEIQALTHPEDQAADAQAFRELLAGARDHYRAEKRYLRPDGRPFWGRVAMTFIRDDAGRPVSAVALVEDIAVQRQAQAEVEAQRSELAAIYTSSLDAIVVFDDDSRLLEINPAGAALGGAPRAALLGRRLDQMLVDFDWPAALAELHRAGHQRGETRLRRADGAVREIEYASSANVGAGRHVSVVHDITHRKAVETALRERTAELEALYQASRQLSQSLEVGAIYRAFPDLLGQRVACDALYISTFTPADNLIRCAFGWHWGAVLDTSALPPIPLEPEGRGAQSIVIRAGRAWRLDDYQAQIRTAQTSYLLDEDGRVSTDPAPDEDRPRSALIVPLILAGQVTGVLQVLSFRLAAYTDTDLRFAEALAAQLAAALHNAALFAKTQAELAARQLAEADLRDSEGRFRQLAENIQEVFWLYEPLAERMIYISPAYEIIWGQPRASLYAAPRSFISRLHLEDQPLLSAALAEQAAGRTTEREYRVLHPDGSVRWVWDRGFPIMDEAGRVVRVAGIAADITDRKLAEAEIRALNTSLEHRVAERTAELAAVTQLQRAILDSADAVIISVDLAGLITSFNAGAERLMGYAAAEVIGRLTPLALHDPAEVAARAAALARELGRPVAPLEALMHGVRATGRAEGEWQLVRRDGRRFPAWLTVTGIQQSDGQLAGFLGIATDLSTRKQIEAELNAQRDLARQVMETMEQGLLIFDAAGLVEYANPHLAGLLGRPAASLVGRSALDFVAPEAHAQVRAGYARRQTGESDCYEIPMLTRDGRRLPMLLTSTPRRREGQFIGGIAILTDLTQIKEAEARLRFQAQTLEAVEQAVIATDLSLGVIYWNRAAERLFGWSVAESYGQNITALVAGDLEPAVIQTIETQVRGGLAWVGDLPLRRRAADAFHGLVSVSRLTGEAGQPLGFIAAVADITAQRQAEAELRRSRDQLSFTNRELARANRLKDDFLASISHELRTPLTGILGLAEALQNGVYGPLADRQTRTVQLIEESGRHLLNLINDILDLSKVEAGQMVLHWESFSAADICQASLRLIRQLAQARRQNVEYHLAAPDLTLRGDARRVKQILVNLLSNAAKFTPEAGEFGLEVQADAAAGQVRFTVWDRGIGIAPEDLPRLFQPFVQLDGGLARQYAGSGLGLALVKRLADLHGGGISVESAPGQGSRFTLTLPWSEAASTPEPAAGLPAAPAPARRGLLGAGRLALLVEDNETNISVFTDFLRVAGFQVAVARDGVEALDLAPQLAPAVILMDIQLPRLNGLEVIRQLRRLAVPAPILALTALAMPGDQERCLAAGANAYLSKPVSLGGLQACLEALLQGASPEGLEAR